MILSDPDVTVGSYLYYNTILLGVPLLVDIVLSPIAILSGGEKSCKIDRSTRVVTDSTSEESYERSQFTGQLAVVIVDDGPEDGSVVYKESMVRSNETGNIQIPLTKTYENYLLAMQGTLTFSNGSCEIENQVLLE